MCKRKRIELDKKTATEFDSSVVVFIFYDTLGDIVVENFAEGRRYGGTTSIVLRETR